MKALANSKIQPVNGRSSPQDNEAAVPPLTFPSPTNFTKEKPVSALDLLIPSSLQTLQYRNYSRAVKCSLEHQQ